MDKETIMNQLIDINKLIIKLNNYLEPNKFNIVKEKIINKEITNISQLDSEFYDNYSIMLFLYKYSISNYFKKSNYYDEYIYDFIKNINKKLFTNKEFLLELLKINPKILNYTNRFDIILDREIIEKYIFISPHKINIFYDDKEFIIKMININKDSYLKLNTLKYDKDVMRAYIN
jgi:hypothetical protein